MAHDPELFQPCSWGDILLGWFSKNKQREATVFSGPLIIPPLKKSPRRRETKPTSGKRWSTFKTEGPNPGPWDTVDFSKAGLSQNEGSPRFLGLDSTFFPTILLFKSRSLFPQRFLWFCRKIRMPGFRMETEGTPTKPGDLDHVPTPPPPCGDLGWYLPHLVPSLICWGRHHTCCKDSNCNPRV